MFGGQYFTINYEILLPHKLFQSVIKQRDLWYFLNNFVACVLSIGSMENGISKYGHPSTDKPYLNLWSPNLWNNNHEILLKEISHLQLFIL